MQTLARAICRKEGLDPATLQPLPGGQVNHVFRVGDGYVLRIGAREDAHQRLRQETALLQRLAGQVPVPRVYATGEHDGAPYQIQHYVTGQKLHAAWKDLTPAAQERVAAQLAGTLQVLHRESPSAFGAPFADAPRHPTWAGYLTARFHKSLAEIQALGIAMAPGFVEMAADYFQAHAAALDGGAPTLVHGDLWLGNILVEGERITAILDFEYALHAPADYELNKIEDFCLYPNDYAEEENEDYTSADFAGFATLLRRHDPALFAVPRLRERLNLYHLDSALADYLAWRKDNLAAIPPERMAAKNFYMARITNFIFDHGARIF